MYNCFINWDLIPITFNAAFTYQEMLGKIIYITEKHETAIDLLNTQVAALNTQINTINNNITDIKTNIQTLQTDVESVKNRVSTTESQIAQINTEISSIDARLESVEDQATQNHSDIQDINTGINIINNQITELSERDYIKYNDINVSLDNSYTFSALQNTKMLYINVIIGSAEFGTPVTIPVRYVTTNLTSYTFPIVDGPTEARPIPYGVIRVSVDVTDNSVVIAASQKQATLLSIVEVCTNG